MNSLKFQLLLFLLLAFLFSRAQHKIKPLEMKVFPTVCYASGKVEKGFIPPPFDLDLKSASEKKSEIIVEYSLFPANAKAAFEYAVNIWEHIIESEVPIYIQANWRSQDKNVLGSAGPRGYYTDFKNIPRENRYYPVAVAEKITGKEITGPSSPDIVADFNKDINWYFGTDGKTPDLMYDFATVVLHEITHGLGFTGFFFVRLNNGAYTYDKSGDAAAFDILVVNHKDDHLVDTTVYDNYSLELGNAFISNALYANSLLAIAENENIKPKLYAPSVWDDGSSIYHLNDATYPSGSKNSLMTHAIGKGEAVHDPGPITTGLMYDIGWKHTYLDLTKPKDIEAAQAIPFNLSVKSDIEIDQTSLFVYYSYDNFKNHIDSIPLLFSSSLNLFNAVLNPDIETGKIDYYIQAKDISGRKFTLPTEAPKVISSVIIGPDNLVPKIVHSPFAYYLLAQKGLTISAFVDDNLGVDTVFVEYQINGETQIPFGLKLDSANLYSGEFNFDMQLLNDTDKITYTITARDSSLAQNTMTIPEENEFSFIVEKIFDPTTGYVNDFDATSSDFILSGFDIYNETNFLNPALNSLHPYLSPKQNDAHFDYTAILKRPIILGNSSIMTFDEIVLVEPGEFQSKYGDDDFWDYVIVEGSKDYGETWLPLIDGYDSDEETIWKDGYFKEIVDQESLTEGIPDWYVNRSINLLDNNNFVKNDTILIRFRLFSDPFANGWGWAIDNLRIQTPVASPITSLSPGNILVYPNPFNSDINVIVQLKKQTNELEISVFNLFGEKIYGVQNKNLSGEISYKIDLRNFAAGMYFVSVKENGKQVLSKKIIKNQD